MVSSLLNVPFPHGSRCQVPDEALWGTRRESNRTRSPGAQCKHPQGVAQNVQNTITLVASFDSRKIYILPPQC